MKIKQLWKDFWFKPKHERSSRDICYGRTYTIQYKFRTQRLVNIIMFIIITILIFKII
jgi:hypothetical protein